MFTNRIAKLFVAGLSLMAFTFTIQSAIVKASNQPVVTYSNALELQYAQPWLKAPAKDHTFRTPPMSDYVPPEDHVFHTPPMSDYVPPVDHVFHTPPMSDYVPPEDHVFHTPPMSDNVP